jgi:NADPH:quinone reductase-like Zn-dependent oxidoreductase
MTLTKAQTMKAIVYRAYGGPERLRLEDVPVPELQPNGLLIRVRAASINALDWHLLRGKPYIARLDAGFRGPKRAIPGVDVAGTVEAVGSEVTGFQPGDEVFADNRYTLAETVAGRAALYVHRPANLTPEQAAAIPAAGVTALQALRDHGQLQPGQHVLVYGAGGGVGTFTVQVAKALGAEVTGVTRTENLELIRSIGADHVIDYTAEDPTRRAERYDLIVDNGATRPVLALRRVLAPTGRMVLVGASKGDWIGPMVRIVGSSLLARFGDQTITGMLAKPTAEDLRILADMAADGRIRPVIDRTYPLAQAAEAIAYLETMRARGKVVISVDGSSR